jgi:hypothetical protein
MRAGRGAPSNCPVGLRCAHFTEEELARALVGLFAEADRAAKLTPHLTGADGSLEALRETAIAQSPVA